jgi:hypothetical protein
MRIWPACVTPAKNNFICESIEKRVKRTRDAEHFAGRYPGAGLPHAGAYNSVPILESDGAHAPYVLTIVYTVTQTTYGLQREILRMRAKPACVSKSAWH